MKLKDYVPVITNVKDFKHPSAPRGISFEPGVSGPPRVRKFLYVIIRRCRSAGSSCFVVGAAEIVAASTIV